MFIQSISIYVDGACSGNPGPGGWAAMLVAETTNGQKTRLLEGHEPYTTNNQMELTAVVYGLQAITRPYKIKLFTDSTYVQSALTGGKMKANAGLVTQVREMARAHQVEVRLIRAHTGGTDEASRFNDIVDRAARAQSRRAY